MREIRKASKVDSSSEGFSVNGNITPEIISSLPKEEISRIWGGDRRLSLFNYTIETINMLILPMMKTK